MPCHIIFISLTLEMLIGLQSSNNPDEFSLSFQYKSSSQKKNIKLIGDRKKERNAFHVVSKIVIRDSLRVSMLRCNIERIITQIRHLL